MDPKIYNATSKNSYGEFACLESDSGLQITCGKGNTILHVAVISGSQDAASHILKLHRNPSLPFETNNDGDTPLHIAARLGHLDVVSLLADHFELLGVLEAARDPFCALNAKKNTALHEAVQKGHAGIVELLLRKDKRLASLTNEAGESPVFLAVDRGYFDIARNIFESSPDCSLFGRKGMTVMHAATLRFQDSFLQDVLKRCGSEILEIPDNFGWMPLHHAARVGNVFAVQLFLETNSSLACIKDSEGMTALHIAARNGHRPIISKLIESRSDIGELLDNRGQTALHVAIESGETDVVKLLVDTAAFLNLIDEQDQDGNTSLHIAAINCDYGSLKVLGSDKRIDKGVINNKNMTAVDIILENDKLTTLGKARISALLNKSGGLPSFEQSYTSERKEQCKVSQNKAIQEGDDDAIPISQTDKSEDEGLGLSKERDNELANGTSDIAKKEQSPLFSNLEKASSINLLIATIIVSATYAAAIQVPGGLNSEGMPNLKSKPDFKYFMLYNSMAFGSAVGSMITYFIDELLPKHRIERKIMTRVDMIRFSSIFLNMMFTLFSSIFLVVSYEYATRAIWYTVSDLEFTFFSRAKGKYFTSTGLPGTTASVLVIFPLIFLVISVYTQTLSYARVLALRRRMNRGQPFFNLFNWFPHKV